MRNMPATTAQTAVVDLFPDATPDEVALWKANPQLAFDHWQRRRLVKSKYPQSDNALRQYRAMFGKVVRELATQQPPHTLLSADATALLAFLRSLTGIAPPAPKASGLDAGPQADLPPARRRTLRRYLKLLDDVYAHLAHIGARRGNPAQPLLSLRDFLPEAPPLPPALMWSATERLIRNTLDAEATTWVQLRDRAMILTPLATGLKASEVVMATVEGLQLDERQPYIEVRAHGLREGRNAGIAPWLIQPLRQWLAKRAEVNPETSALFISQKGDGVSTEYLYEKTAAAMAQAGFGHRLGRGPTALRNAWALRQMVEGATPEEVRKMLGLQSLTTVTRLEKMLPNKGGRAVV
jgi:site-specific recombinase XerD